MNKLIILNSNGPVLSGNGYDYTPPPFPLDDPQLAPSYVFLIANSWPFGFACVVLEDNGDDTYSAAEACYLFEGQVIPSPDYSAVVWPDGIVVGN